jgi:AraC-like DNA-binding protein
MSKSINTSITTGTIVSSGADAIYGNQSRAWQITNAGSPPYPPVPAQPKSYLAPFRSTTHRWLAQARCRSARRARARANCARARGRQWIFFAGTGLLDLADPIAFNGTITGFSASDRIDLLNTPEASYTYTNNTLTVKNGSSSSFSLISATHGGTFIEFKWRTFVRKAFEAETTPRPGSETIDESRARRGLWLRVLAKTIDMSVSSLAASYRLQSHARPGREVWAFRSVRLHLFRKFHAGITLPPVFAVTGLPMFRFSASGLIPDEGFQAWREIMARMFHIDPSRPAGGLPRGGMSAFVLGDIMVNRSIFNAQRLSRDSRRIAATPDHLVLQFYRAGGFSGEMNGAPVRIARGQIAICDLRRPLDVQAITSDTVGLTVPRHLLEDVDLSRLPGRLDPARERLLAVRVTTLHHRLPKITRAEIPAITADLLAALRCLFDPSASTDVLETPALDADLLGLAERIIAGALASPDLSPATIAERLHVSRATLYRMFAPFGGVMQHVWDMRLEAVRAALEQPSEPRTLTRLAEDCGFRTASHLSRVFRAQFGATPRDWRRQQAVNSGAAWQAESARLNALWRELGR